MKLINQIKEIDTAIKNNDAKISAVYEDEKNMISTHELSKTKERESVKAYHENPTEDNQKKLTAAREFSISCQKRKMLFKNNSGVFKNDNKILWSKRKTLVSRLAQIRIKETRKILELERQGLLKTLYPDVIRLMSLTSHLDGLSILQLDFNRMMQKCSHHFKADLDDSSAKLKEQFETLT